MARKLIFFLCVGVVVLLSITLTALGYTQASRDLQEQAEAALLAEGQSVATAVDAWNAHALVERQAIVGLPSVLRLLATNAGARDADLASADEALASFRTVDPDATALILADAQGQIVVSTEPGSQGLVSQRPAFREALAWRTSITGVSAGTQTGRRDIFRDAPVRAADGRVLGGVVMRSGIHTVQQHAHAPRAQLVLVVDDDASARGAAPHAGEGRLERDRRQERAGGARAAGERGPPTLILLDLLMPQMSAFELLAALRERDAWWTIAVIVLTAKDLAPNERQWLTDHVPVIMPKGAYRRDELLREIRVRIASGAVGAV